MHYKDIESAEHAITQIRKDINSINKQISAYYKEGKEGREDWLRRAMYAKNGKRLRIKKIETWIAQKKTGCELDIEIPTKKKDLLEQLFPG